MCGCLVPIQVPFPYVYSARTPLHLLSTPSLRPLALPLSLPPAQRITLRSAAAAIHQGHGHSQFPSNLPLLFPLLCKTSKQGSPSWETNKEKVALQAPGASSFQNGSAPPSRLRHVDKDSSPSGSRALEPLYACPSGPGGLACSRAHVPSFFLSASSSLRPLCLEYGRYPRIELDVLVYMCFLSRGGTGGS